LLSLTRGKTTRHMFFIQDKLWKIIDEHSLGEETEYGKDFTAAVTKLAKSFGVAGRVIPADPEKQQYSTVVDWEDPRSHIRAIERGDSGFALVMEESATLARIESLRPNKPADL